MPVNRHDLQCEVIKLDYDFENQAGRLWIAETQTPDQSGLTKIFIAIDPNAKLIEVFAGDRPDCVFKLGPSGWESVTSR